MKEGCELFIKVDNSNHHAEIKSITRFHKVDTKKKTIIEMPQAEKDAILQAEQDKINQQIQFIEGIKTKLRGIGLNDEEVDYIISLDR